MSVHPRVALNGICTLHQSLDEDLALWADLGIRRVGIISPKLDAHGWDASAEIIRNAGLVISSMSCRPDQFPESLEFTAAIGGELFYAVSGGYGTVAWEEAAESYRRDMTPLVARARELGVRLAVEPTNPLRCDVSFVHTVRDAIDVARMVGIGLCLDLYSGWYERGLERLVRENIDLLALVQICDYRIGGGSPGRCAVGDGDIPLERLMAMLLDAGYEGLFELELLGPEIDEEGYRGPIERSLERASEMLERLGA